MRSFSSTYLGLIHLMPQSWLQLENGTAEASRFKRGRDFYVMNYVYVRDDSAESTSCHDQVADLKALQYCNMFVSSVAKLVGVNRQDSVNGRLTNRRGSVYIPKNHQKLRRRRSPFSQSQCPDPPTRVSCTVIQLCCLVSPYSSSRTPSHTMISLCLEVFGLFNTALILQQKNPIFHREHKRRMKLVGTYTTRGSRLVSFGFKAY
ncbi:hypothetical protein BS47DRAFT_952798 [Hydnum rufescens UP504]|uniref:Uncharacterized protein n=1 Tax=Hydnum rufescens UP504 TaxID=1448309 RepID=A0A9P6AX18_9AGAM|nr:hypothetical protein BS47DRAFT_952798 [Hydnum rufescens UP504]